MTAQTEVPNYTIEVEQFCDHVKDAFQPDCIILHGSQSRGSATPTSDVDIIIISDQLPQSFIERLYQLNRLREGGAPIEALGYTRAEWEQMLEHLHLTALEAIHWGIPLWGETLFEQWKHQLESWQKLGLQRGEFSWSVPPRLRLRLSQL